MKKHICVLMLVALAAVSLNATFAGAQEMKAHSGSHTKPLYERLGGKKAITAVVDEFVNIVAADGRSNTFFKKTASDPKVLASFKGKLVDQICQGTGGPCKYKGTDMKSAHMGLGISGGDFGA